RRAAIQRAPRETKPTSAVGCVGWGLARWPSLQRRWGHGATPRRAGAKRAARRALDRTQHLAPSTTSYLSVCRAPGRARSFAPNERCEPRDHAAGDASAARSHAHRCRSDAWRHERFERRERFERQHAREECAKYRTRAPARDVDAETPARKDRARTSRENIG